MDRNKGAERKPNQCDVDTESIGGVGWVEDVETCTVRLGLRGSSRVVRQRKGRSRRSGGEKKREREVEIERVPLREFGGA